MPAEEGLTPHEMLWVPWRAQWVANSAADPADRDCPFCRDGDPVDSIENLVVARGRTTLVMLNLFPYTGGHLLVVPRRHVRTLAELSVEERGDLMEEIARCQAVLETTHHPHGFNVGLNEGKAGGAGIATHLHWHVVPRWMGDASFMTSVAGLRVVPDDLGNSWKRIRAAFESLGA